MVKSRKLGFSTIELADNVANCATNENQRCVIVSAEDRAQFAQLIGYTVNGFGELGYVPPRFIEAADAAAAALKASTK